jgi:ubiquinone/menaquinone biosynthesis C-methylase UbiE
MTMATRHPVSATPAPDQTQTRTAWNEIATGYDTFVTPTHLPVAHEAVTLAGLRTGMRFLDVAAGSGALSLPAARLGARVLATDLSPVMVERLRARAARESVSNVEARVMDGHALDLEDDSFDVAGSQFGVMLFPDLPRGLRELARVTKPGGRVLLVVYGAPTQVEFLSFFIAAIQSVVPGFVGLPSNPPPLPFQVADPEKLRRVLRDAGLNDIRLETVTERLEFRSGQEMWDWVVNSNPVGRMLVADLTDEQGGDVRRVLDGMLRERSGGTGPAVLTNPVHIAVGVK